MQTGLLPVERSYPLTRAQARLFFLHQLDPEAGTYVFPVHLRLRGPLDIDALDSALADVVERHEILRSTIEVRGERAVQVVQGRGFELRQLDLRGVAEPERGRREGEAVDRETNSPFDFGVALMRGLLIRRDDEDFLLLLSFHHIIFDGWSVGVLMRELGAGYRRHLGEPTAVVAPLAMQYGEYAEREASEAAEVTRPLEEFWRRTLTPVPPSLRLPTDRPRPRVLSGRADRVSTHVDAELAAALDRRARQQRATLYMLLLTAYQVLLGRLSGQTDFCVGGGASGRHDPVTHPMIGTLVNELVYRSEYDPDASYTQVIARTRRRALDVYRHDRLPFERLVEVVSPTRSLSHHPLFQYAITLQPEAGPGIELKGIEIDAFDSGAEGSALDVAASFHRDGDRLACVVDFSADLWDQPWGEAFAADLVSVLRQIADDPEQPVGRVRLSCADRHGAVGSASAAPATGEPVTVADGVGAAAEERERAVAALLDIWKETLGLDSLGPDENFFDVGGDSLLGLRVVASARKAGYPMRPRHIFLGQTVRDLAAVLLTEVLGARGKAEGGRTAATTGGAVPLLPIQSWFLMGADADAGQYNYTNVFEVASGVSDEQLSAAVDAALSHHDAFRLRFGRSRTGEWHQSYGTPPPGDVLRVFDFSWMTPRRAEAALDRAVRTCQTSVSLADGPLVSCALFTLPAGRRELLVAAHHLIMDPASMSILADDIATACGQAARGERIELLPQYSSYQDWGRSLEELAGAEETRAEADYWRRVSGAASNRVRVDHPEGRNDVASQVTLAESLDPAATRALRFEVTAATGATLTEIVLAGAAAALRPLTGGAAVLADFETHGREDLVDSIDLSRTVGWFSALFPVVVPALDPEPGRHLEQAVAALRGVPRGGLGHGLLTFVSKELPHRRNHVGVTYLGTAAGGSRAGSALTFARFADHDRMPTMTRPHELEIGAITDGDTLAFSVTYSGNRYPESRVKEMLAKMRTYFEDLIADTERSAGAAR